MLFGCNIDNKRIDPTERYMDMADLINSYDTFLDHSNYFDIHGEIDIIEESEYKGKYRFYIFIDNPRIAMYDVEAMAIEKNKDYESQMAANIGIFDEIEYTLIPNQANPDKGYYKGIVISGISEKANTSLYVLVQWRNSEMSLLHREFFKVDVSYEGV